MPLEESVVTAMDGSDVRLFPFLPYILQDVWEIGADPDVMVRLIAGRFPGRSGLRVLDLGCGKGAVSVRAAEKLDCSCLGIDALPEFIAEAARQAEERGVARLCRFETGDIRIRARELSGFDAVILGAIGPVFGDYETTLKTLSHCVGQDGAFIIDDGYVSDESGYTRPMLFKKRDILAQMDRAGMRLAEEAVIPPVSIRASDKLIWERLKKRCLELMKQHPGQKPLFQDYLRKQEEENDVLENRTVCSAMAVVRK